MKIYWYRSKVFFVATLLHIFVSSCQNIKANSESSLMMGGGKEAQVDQFPSALQLIDCSATKVGRRLILTAAHCVVDSKTGGIRSDLQRGKRVAVYYGVHLETAEKWVLTVEQVMVSPHLLSVLDEAKTILNSQSDIDKFLKLKADFFADVALISFSDKDFDFEKFSLRPMAQIGVNPVSKEDELIATGYGCETMVSDGDVFTVSRKSNDAGDLDRPSGRLKWASFKYNDKSPLEYWYAEANAYAPDIGLCFGDSGSGLYLGSKMNTRPQVVVGIGVAINYKSQREFFTRFDTDSLEKVGHCLTRVANKGLPNIQARNGFYDFCAN